MKSSKASADQLREGGDWDGLGKKALLPEAAETAQDGGNVVLINGRGPRHNRPGRSAKQG